MVTPPPAQNDELRRLTRGVVLRKDPVTGAITQVRNRFPMFSEVHSQVLSQEIRRVDSTTSSSEGPDSIGRDSF